MHRISNETRCIGVAFGLFLCFMGELSENQIITKINNKKTREKTPENPSYLYNFYGFAFVVFYFSNIRHCRLCLLVGLLPSICVPLSFSLCHFLHAPLSFSLFIFYLALFFSSLCHVVPFFGHIMSEDNILHISVWRMNYYELQLESILFVGMHICVR